MGLCETQNRLGQSETLMLFLSKNKFEFVSSKNKIGVSFAPCFIQPFAPTTFSETFLKFLGSKIVIHQRKPAEIKI
jgi:hypothetical protein